MPAVYAHDYFGAKVSERLYGDIKDIVTKYYTQFSVGLQGPDIFFFYEFYTNNKVTNYGNHLHHISALPFFRHAASLIRQKGRNSREYAYLLGFICHFILDSECHPYVTEMIEKTGVQHLEIEEEFEKKLLRMNGHDPFSFPIAELIPTDALTAETIHPFYCKGIDQKTVRASLRYMKLIKQFFTAPCPVKYRIIDVLMKLSGKYVSFKGLMHQRTDNLACTKSNKGLLERFDNAIDIAVSMIYSFDESLQTKTALNERFDRTFE